MIGLSRLWARNGKVALLYDQMINMLLSINTGTKTKIAVLPFSRSIDPTTLGAAEWAFFVVTSDDVLPELWTDVF
jgi:hypothetical protein